MDPWVDRPATHVGSRRVFRHLLLHACLQGNGKHLCYTSLFRVRRQYNEFIEVSTEYGLDTKFTQT